MLLKARVPKYPGSTISNFKLGAKIESSLARHSIAAIRRLFSFVHIEGTQCAGNGPPSAALDAQYPAALGSACHAACELKYRSVPEPLARNRGSTARVILRGPWKFVLKTSSISSCLVYVSKYRGHRYDRVNTYVSSSIAPLKM